MEAALLAERVALWRDLSRYVWQSIDEVADEPRDLVERIRAIGEAVGYATDPDDVNEEMEAWRYLVDTYPMFGLFPQRGMADREMAIQPSEQAIHYYSSGLS